jgi:hypothetical protein
MRHLIQTKAQKILTRVRPCSCGCKGRDSWHKRSLRRTVHNVEYYPSPRVIGGLAEYERVALARGHIDCPWGGEEVLWEGYRKSGENKITPLGWTLATLQQ